MMCVIRTMNPATHSFAEAILKDAGIESFRFDYNSSIMDGYTAMIPRRLMVIDDDAVEAREPLRAAGLGDEIYQS